MGIEVGDIFHDNFDDLCNPPKPKFYIVVGKTNDGSEFATVYINTHQYIDQINSEQLLSLHLPVTCRELSFLSHDSYIDCSNLKTRFPGSIDGRPKGKEVRLKCKCPNNILERVKNKIREAKSVTKHLKDLYGI